MNSLHDMGGMHGFGPIAPEDETREPLFHEPWEARALALTLAAGAWGRWTLDESRHARESLPAQTYVNSSYYEKWILGLETLMLRHGLVTAQELASGRPDPGVERLQPALPGAVVPGMLASGGPVDRPSDAAPRFAVGDRVRARNLNPAGHTRLPRYVRGRVGEIVRVHGVHVFPDSHAHGGGEDPRPLYLVRFDAAELWGEADAFRGVVNLDLWEPYLDPA